MIDIVTCFFDLLFSFVGFSSSFCVFFFFKQKTAYEMRISDWSSDVCSSDLSLDIDGKMIAARLVRDISGEVSLDTVDSLQCEACHEGAVVAALRKIGRASCRERVCQYV